jgi:L-2-hydroxyglutarate oxidase LhgO
LKYYDYLIVGAGIIGMTIALELLKKNPNTIIAIIDKENDIAKHASGRNSGVLHAGFYYSEDSLKAKFTVEGNRRMKKFCAENNIPVRATKKVVIARNEEEVDVIIELHRKAQVNGVETYIINQSELKAIDPNAKTYKQALFSPTTASVDPKEVCLTLKKNLKEKGVDFYFNTPYPKCPVKYHYLINCAGAYADKIAHQFGIAHQYTMLPFKGMYLKYMENKTAIKTNIYPVPNLANPFLGVHYTITADGSIKIGPTAIPALWRENYRGFDNFNLFEVLEITFYIVKLFCSNAFNFRTLALNEIKNYNPKIFIQKAKTMVNQIGNNFQPIPAGIRAQLLNIQTQELVQDFIVEHTKNSTHILNAVSPAFTCSFAFAEYVIENIYQNKGK